MMKKTMILVCLLLVTALMLVGCSNDVAVEDFNFENLQTTIENAASSLEYDINEQLALDYDDGPVLALAVSSDNLDVVWFHVQTVQGSTVNIMEYEKEDQVMGLESIDLDSAVDTGNTITAQQLLAIIAEWDIELCFSGADEGEWFIQAYGEFIRVAEKYGPNYFIYNEDGLVQVESKDVATDVYYMPVLLVSVEDSGVGSFGYETVGTVFIEQ